MLDKIHEIVEIVYHSFAAGLISFGYSTRYLMGINRFAEIASETGLTSTVKTHLPLQILLG